MADNHIIEVRYTGKHFFITRPITRYDYGQVYRFIGFDLPSTFEVHFASENSATAVTQIGTNDEVTIPDTLLTVNLPVKAWVFLHDGEDDGETTYWIESPITDKAQVTNQPPTPVQQDVITQTIAALNEAVADAEAAAQSLKGATAAATTLSAGSNATATLTESEGVFSFEFGIPRGADGQNGTDGKDGKDGSDGKDGKDGTDGVDGVTPDFSIGTVATGDAGSSASATITGTTDAPVLNLTIPRGDPGSVPIDDTAGAGDLTKVWSADKLTTITGQLNGALNELTTDVESMQLDKADVIVSSASGAIASFPDGMAAPAKQITVGIEPVQDLHGYDSPWPAGGGKNLLQVTAETQTVNGVTFTVNSDGTIATSGTATAQIRFVCGSVISSGNNYSGNGCPQGGEIDVTYGLFFGNMGADSGSGVNNKSVAAGSNILVRILIENGVNCNGLVFKPMLRLASVTDATFAPYSNLCPITGWTGTEITRTGKNLLASDVLQHASWSHTEYGGSMSSNASNGTYTLPTKPNTQYTLSIPSANHSTVAQYISFCKSNKAKDTTSLVIRFTTDTWSRDNYTFTTDNDSLYYIRMGNSSTEEFFNAQIEKISYFQLEPGSTASSYSPYVGSTYPITFPSSAGTVYGGSMTVNEDGTGQLVVDRAEVDLGTLTFTKNDSSLIGVPCFYATIPSVKAGASYVACSDYAIKRQRTVIDGTGQISPGNGSDATYCVIRDDRYAAVDAASFKAALQAANAQLVYELAEPITYDLTALEVLELLKSQNNVWSSTGDTSVTYRADTKLYIDNKVTQAIAAAVAAL